MFVLVQIASWTRVATCAEAFVLTHRSYRSGSHSDARLVSAKSTSHVGVPLEDITYVYLHRFRDSGSTDVLAHLIPYFCW